jgi:large subunit ribosomal protein L19e
MQITNQRRMAADILSQREGRIVGVHRIWVHPDYIDQISSAVQKTDIREMIDEGIIRARPIQGTSRSRARKLASQKAKGRRRGHGSRKGSANARDPKKGRWMRTIRAQRRVLKELRGDETITPSQYRYHYRKAKGGTYRSIAHMRSNMELEGIELGGES